MLIPYTAAKHGVVGLTKAAAMHGARNGIRANTICPGFIVTGLMGPLRESLGSDEALDGLEQSIPMQRFGTPAEVGALVTYLLSDDASYVTGAVVPIDAAYSSGAAH